MKRFKKIFLSMGLILILCSTANASGMPVVDVLNATLNELRNQLMQSQFAQDIAVATQRLNVLRETYLEMIRYHSGFDDFVSVLLGDPGNRIGRDIANARNAFQDVGPIFPQIQALGTTSDPFAIRDLLSTITGQIPAQNQRPYIPFEESQVVEAFQLAQTIREEGVVTRNAARSIANLAKTASPKGAARLQAEAISQLILMDQQRQDALAKLIELSATQVEQRTREEKRLEAKRIQVMRDASDLIESLSGAF